MVITSTSATSTIQSSTTPSATPSLSSFSTSTSTSAQSTTPSSATPALSSTSTDLSTSASSAPASSSTSSSTPISSATITSPSTTATPTPTPSTSSTTPSAPQYTNFCLRVTTPTSSVYGAIIHNGRVGQNLILGDVAGLNNPVVFFTLESTSRLVTTTGFPLSPYLPTSPTSVLRPFTQASINQTPEAYAQEYCTVTQSGELVCAAQGGLQQSVFARVGANLQLFAATADAVSALVVPLNLGVFFGDKCVDGSSL